MKHAYCAMRMVPDDCDWPEVRLFESNTEAADWLFDFEGGEDEDCLPLREQLYSGRSVDLCDGQVRVVILNLTVKWEGQ